MKASQRRFPLQSAIVIAIILDFMAAAVLGYRGFQIHAAVTHTNFSVSDTLYLTMQLFTSASGNVTPMNWALQIARFIAPIVPAGTLLWVISFALREHYHRFKLRRMKNHVVICGLGRNGPQLVREFLLEKKEVVAIEVNPQNEHIRECFEMKANIVIGDASNEEVLHRAHATHASHLIAVAGDDGVNAKIAGQLLHILGPTNTRRGPTCHFHIVNYHLYGLLKDHNLAQTSTNALNYALFNIYQNSARLLFQKYSLADPQRLSAANYTPHLIIVGLGDMGEAVLVQAAKIAHYAPNKGIQITIVDKSASTLVNQVQHRSAGLIKICQITPIDADITNHDKQIEISKLASDIDSPAVIAFCFGNDYLNVTSALEMSKHIASKEVTLLVRIDRHAGYGTLIERMNSSGPSKGCTIHPFGWIESTSTRGTLLEESLDTIARKLYESDQHNSPWVHTPEQTKDIYRQRADHIYVQMMMLNRRIITKESNGDSCNNFTNDQIEMMAGAECRRRVAESDFVPQASGGSQSNSTLTITEEDKAVVLNIPKILAAAGQRILR